VARLLSRSPEDSSYRYLSGVAHGKVGLLLDMLGRTDAAIGAFETSLAIHRELEELDPANAQWRREVAVAHGKLAGALARTDSGAALRHLRRADDTLSELVAADPTNAERRLDLARVRGTLGRVHLGAGDARLAREDAERALDALGPRGPRGANEIDRARRLVEAELHAVRGAALDASGRREEARSAWSEIVALLAPFAPEARDPRVLEPLVRALLRLGRRAEAVPLLDRLRASKFDRAGADPDFG
jgi:tetratricopeptide (TPR) repeat protein